MHSTVFILILFIGFFLSKSLELHELLGWTSISFLVFPLDQIYAVEDDSSENDIRNPKIIPLSILDSAPTTHPDRRSESAERYFNWIEKNQRQYSLLAIVAHVFRFSLCRTDGIFSWQTILVIRKKGRKPDQCGTHSHRPYETTFIRTRPMALGHRRASPSLNSSLLVAFSSVILNNLSGTDGSHLRTCCVLLSNSIIGDRCCSPREFFSINVEIINAVRLDTEP